MSKKEGTYRNQNVTWRRAMGVWVKSCIKLIESVHKHTDTFSDIEYECLCEYLLGGNFELIAKRRGITHQAVNYAVVRALNKFEQAMERQDEILKENTFLKSEIERKGIQMNYNSFDEAREGRKALLDTPVEQLSDEIGAKACSSLIMAGILTIGDIIEKKKSKIRLIRGVGKYVEQIQTALTKRGLKFGMDKNDFIEMA